jgi:hypothetical protein
VDQALGLPSFVKTIAAEAERYDQDDRDKPTQK